MGILNLQYRKRSNQTIYFSLQIGNLLNYVILEYQKCSQREGTTGFKNLAVVRPFKALKASNVSLLETLHVQKC